MALISYVEDAIYLERLSSPKVANLLRVLFHSPDWAEAFVKLASTQMRALSLPAKDRELVFLQTGYLLAADYVVARHEGISDVLGISQAQRDALRSRGRVEGLFSHRDAQQRSSHAEDALFSDREKALLRFVTTLVERTYPNEAALADASRFFSEVELVEIVGVQGFAATVAAITRTFQVDIDPIGGKELMRFSEEITGG